MKLFFLFFFWDDDFNSCFIRRGSMKYFTLTVCVTVPDNLLERYKQYKQQIVELLKDATYHDITPGKEFGTVFEMKTDTKDLDNVKAIVAIMKLVIIGHSIPYHKLDMKCLDDATFFYANDAA